MGDSGGGSLVPRLRSLVEAAERGQAWALAELEALVGRDEDAREVVTRLVPNALDRWCRRRAGGNEVALIAVRAMVEALRRELCADGASGLELILVDRVIVCWLALEVAELAYLDKTEGEHSRQAAGWYADRVSQAQARLLAAVRALAQARKVAEGEVVRRLPGSG